MEERTILYLKYEVLPELEDDKFIETSNELKGIINIIRNLKEKEEETGLFKHSKLGE